ncbi:DMT family transporter [Granulosicoccus sp. 3-233]
MSILFVLMWSSGWVAARLAVTDMDVVTLLVARYLIVVLVLFLLVSLLRQWRRVSLSELLQQMLVGSLVHGIYLMAALSAFEEGVSAGLVAFIMTLHPMLTATLSSRVNGEEVSARQWQGLLIGTLAIVLSVSDSYRHGASGAALALPFLAVLALTVGSLLNRHLELNHKARAEPPLPVMLVLLMQGIGALLVLLPLRGSSTPLQFASFDADEWVLLLWLALIASLGAYALLQILLRHLSTTRVASLGYLVPPATMLQSYLIFGESLSLADAGGLALAAIGVHCVMSPGRARPSVASERTVSMRQSDLPVPAALPLTLRTRRVGASTAPLDIEL